jgi:superfamily I DNA and RNA helicase
MENFKTTSVDIPVNCRNTLLILNQTKWATGADMGIRGIGDGPSVTWQSVTDIKAEAALLESHLKKLLMEERLEPKQITILVLNSRHNPLDHVSDSLRNRIKEISPKLVENWNERTITWSDVPTFKGLENIAICVVGGRELNKLRSPLNFLYVAMSRAQAFLWIATTKELGELVRTRSEVS